MPAENGPQNVTRFLPVNTNAETEGSGDARKVAAGV